MKTRLFNTLELGERRKDFEEHLKLLLSMDEAPLRRAVDVGAQLLLARTRREQPAILREGGAEQADLQRASQFVINVFQWIQSDEKVLEDSPESIAEDLISSGLCEPGQRSNAVRLFSVIQEKWKEIADQVERRLHALALVPTVSKVGSVVDLRCVFSVDGKVSDLVPVALVSLVLSNGKEVTFQVESETLGTLVATLTTLHSQLESAKREVRLKKAQGHDSHS